MRHILLVLVSALVLGSSLHATAAPEVRAVDGLNGRALFYTQPAPHSPATRPLYQCRSSRGTYLSADYDGTCQLLGYLVEGPSCTGVPIGYYRGGFTVGFVVYPYSHESFFLGCAYGGSSSASLVAATVQGSTCDTSCMGLCGGDCTGILGTEIYTNECAQHDQCVYDNGCNRFAPECFGDAVVATASWAVNAVVHVVEVVLDSIGSFFRGWF